MARATRSSAQQSQDAPPEPAPATPRGKAATKKRKRTSIAENDEQPAFKQLRSGDVDIKEEGETEDVPEADKLAELPNAGDVPINADDAGKILDILEMIDTQGLLDRVFPLPSSPAEPSGSQQAFYSFRTLLKESSQHPLCELRSTVQHLFPISFHPRSRPAAPAAQQLSFCNLALSLLDQASFHSVPVPLDLETVVPLSTQSTDEDVDTKTESKPNARSLSRPASESSQAMMFKRKYALMQKLSGTEWWTSLNSDFGTPPNIENKPLKDLSTAHAELVAILPSPSTSASAPDPSITIPTLGSYTKKVLMPRARSIGPRRTSCGSFLDYGPFASFAPSFEGEGVEIGRIGLGETIWRWEERRKDRELQKCRIGTITEVSEGATGDVDMEGVRELESEDVPTLPINGGLTEEMPLEGLLPPEDVAGIIAALGTLELEESVTELLERNRKALLRLEELQKMRLNSNTGGLSEVEEGSEEWDVAQGIMNSLTILASLRPRWSTETSSLPPLIPATHALRKLHRTLPEAPTQGWYGTLPPSRASALRDDSTVRIMSGTVLQNANPVAGPATPSNATGSHYQPHRAGSYQQAQQHKPGQVYYNGQAGTQPQAQQQQQQQYYPNQLYGQNQYQYSSTYYPSSTPTPVANGGTAQPSTGATYGYYNAAQPQAQRAVANTVAVPAKPNGTVPPTIPSHMRNAATWNASASQPTTPTGNYQYGTYQANTPVR